MSCKSTSPKSFNEEYKNNHINRQSYGIDQDINNSEVRHSRSNGTNRNNNVKQELLEISESIEVAREKLNKMACKGERLKLTKEIIEASQQLDILIRDYHLKSIEVEEKD